MSHVGIRGKTTANQDKRTEKVVILKAEGCANTRLLAIDRCYLKTGVHYTNIVERFSI